MTSLPLVSVIIPCYNAENFVESAVRSIMEQTYSNLEIIVINDCSSDNTGEILKRLAEKDPRIKYIENEQNLKLPKTLNKGIKLSKGEYIARMDADDISFPERLEKQIAFLLSNSEIDLVSTNSQWIDENDDILDYRTTHPKFHCEIQHVLPWKCPLVHPSIIARRSFFIDLEGYKEDILFGEDYELWIRGWLEGKMYHCLPEVLLYYRSHKNQMTGTGFNANNAKSIRSFLYTFLLETKNPKFLFGILLQTKIFHFLITKTYKLRVLLK
ncbi:glycosyltransferase family 2 protein [Glaesserella parasuis]|uniref:Glycosyltransferase n=1 Tax=Glaesserella parasuis TaxID=738 RepID=T1RPX3_GLAPU|nr:glycosyltransferase [Glaesserella parasuis]AGM38770.1 hypothetical protein [Glaesserella parasuis]MDG6360461.1 glycosyltransferase [Glaesserella parasuis]MDG6447310.1 glycosyltransferase [Glaesserella parasuis]MDG6466893.1 glycosyltransferase [Glaesserella parasuis]MDO9748801.1 glycosyltransferase [Glaesserella parasuis]